jgi:alcohol dehydrogenase class IV
MELATFRFPTTMRFGPGARSALQEFADDANLQRPLLVTDSGLTGTEAYRLVVEQLDRIWPRGWQPFTDVHPNPVENDATAGAEAFRRAGCDAVIALGGGSAIDGAKAILLKVAQPDTALTEIALDRLPPLIAPLCAIPTTAGTGSEVGRSTVVTIPALGRKAVLGAPALLPQLALLDPELTVGLPPGLTAATGMDAMTHAIEAFVCPLFHPLCDGIALEAIYRIRRYLPRAVKRGDDLDARGEMLVAAAMGAIAFQKDLGAAHSLAHPLGSEFDAHHGLANAVVLPSVIRFNGEEDSSQYRRVAEALGLSADVDPASQVAEFIERFNRELGINQRIRDLGPRENDLPALADKAFADGCHLTNPRKCTRDDLLRLYQESY